MKIIKKAIKFVSIKTGYYYKQLYKSGEKIHSSYTRNNDEKLLYFLMTPSYGNLGDQAIEYATEVFFTTYFPEYTIIKVHLEDTILQLNSIKRNIKKEDLVVLQGGGNFGNLYMECEIVRRYVVNELRNNLIISMPCTVTYTNDKYGKREKDKSMKIFNSNDNLILLSREKYSYEQAKKIFSRCRNILVPDIVFSLYGEDITKGDNREYINICIRTDSESVLGNKRDDIIKTISSKYDKILLTDTQLYRRVSDITKKDEIESILYQFAQSRLVITDRLHGLIFSYITNTPCIVLPSCDNKIRGTYEWIKKSNKVAYIEEYDSERLLELSERLLLNHKVSDESSIKMQFDHLEKLIGDIING